MIKEERVVKTDKQSVKIINVYEDNCVSDENIETKTTDQELQEIKNQNLILMEAIATLYDELQTLKGV